MKKLILLCVIVFSICAVSASAQTKVRVKFPKNSSSITVSGNVKGSNYIDYIVRIEQYNFIESSIKSGGEGVKMTVRKTNGQEFEEGIGVRKFSGESDKTGNYTFRVYNTDGKGVVKFRLTITAYLGT